VLAHAGLDALDRVEVAVLAQQARAERLDQRRRVVARSEVGGDELAGLVDMLLAVEQGRQLGKRPTRSASTCGWGGCVPRLLEETIR
jgi:hypothetical protein